MPDNGYFPRESRKDLLGPFTIGEDHRAGPAVDDFQNTGRVESPLVFVVALGPFVGGVEQNAVPFF